MSNLRQTQRSMFGRMNNRILILEARVSNLEQRSERSEFTGAFARYATAADLPTGIAGLVAYVADNGGGVPAFVGFISGAWEVFDFV